MIIIASAAFCDASLATEFGSIPPSFLPVGNKRLYEHQADLFSQIVGQIKVLTLPIGANTPDQDYAKIVAKGFKCVELDPRLTIGRSIFECLLQVETEALEEPLTIMWGDTLLSPEALSKLLMRPGALSSTSDINYKWHDLPRGRNEGSSNVLVGAFHFASGYELRKELEATSFDFLAVVDGMLELETDGFNEISIDPEGWMDFGLLATFFRSRAKFTTQRSFNSLEVSNGIVWKGSTDSRKIQAEIAWYEGLPIELWLETPRFLGAEQRVLQGKHLNGYALEYIYGSTLAELSVFGSLGRTSWIRIVEQASRLLFKMASVGSSANDSLSTTSSLMVEKPVARFEALGSNLCGVNLYDEISVNGIEVPSVAWLLERAVEVFRAAGPCEHVFAHGDFCFSNLIYDSRSYTLKMFDPRGLNGNGAITQWLDYRYDWLKLGHSIIGGYDDILAGRFDITCGAKNVYTFNLGRNLNPEIVLCFEKIVIENRVMSRVELYYGIISLFLSMLPLHADRSDRQLGLLLNSLRLYSEAETL